MQSWYPLAPLRAGAISHAMNVKKRLLDGPRMNRAIRRMAIEIVEKNRGTTDLIIVGIRTRGEVLATSLGRVRHA